MLKKCKHPDLRSNECLAQWSSFLLPVLSFVALLRELTK